MNKDCIFCGIVAGEQDANILSEDDRIIAFEDINPQAPHHILIVPKQHIESVNQLDETDESLIGHLYTTARKIAESKGFDQSGYRLVMNCGDDALQSVDHLHLHCLAGREMDWPPG